ncbi:hypothetical protein A2V71_03275 [Candidatus Berkelbacteria bacterium RBG_13_40_8]|uniref:ASCH domain-containing protein n=1 Tax=Candidatus Berkelbacteria bacterium RBG_13_40_8 TaxID=1797467 RepID=A0A1F5DPK0_9BACT|nr:MAG: hypothetical protein A2V71_03275 [Candidatus Berkelbacteria bacterium RBG_13_40_8]
MIKERKYLKFDEDQVSKVLKGEISTTVRMFDEKDLKEGDHIVLIERESGEEFGRADVIFVYEKKFGEVEEQDLNNHDVYESLMHMYEKYKDYYGDEVNDETPVKIIRFKLV